MNKSVLSNKPLSSPDTRIRHLLLVCVLIWVGFALRLHNLGEIPFRGDEAFSALYWSGTPIDQSLQQIAAIEPHPPLTYILFRAWGRIFGIESEWLLRLLPTLSNLIGIAAMVALGRLLFGWRYGVLAAFIWTVHPFEIWHSQDFRNYAVWAGLSALNFALAVRVFRYRHPRNWIAYAVCALITTQLFYTELIAIGVLGLYVLFTQWRNRAFVLRWSVLNGAIILACAASFLIVQGDLITSGAYGGTTNRFDPMDWFTRFIPSLYFGETLPPPLTDTAWVIICIILVLMIIAVIARYRNNGILLAMMVSLPLLVLGLISTRMGVFNPRYIMHAVPAYILLLVGSIRILWQSDMQIHKYLAIGLGAGWLSLSALSLNHYLTVTVYEKAPDWPSLANYLDRLVSPNDLVIQTSADAGFGYYYASSATDIALPANPQQPESEIHALLEQLSADHDSLWIVARSFPDWPNNGIVEAWANDRMQRIRTLNVNGLPVQEFRPWQIDEADLPDASLANFAGILILRDFTIEASPDPDGNLTLVVTWQTDEANQSPIKIFVHLVSDNNADAGPIWAQDDQEPLAERMDPLTWEPELLFRDVYQLDLSELPEGSYDIRLGIYNPETGDRLLTAEGEDYFDLGPYTHTR